MLALIIVLRITPITTLGSNTSNGSRAGLSRSARS